MVSHPPERVGVGTGCAGAHGALSVRLRPVRPSLRPRPVERCMSAMQAGTQMVKLRGGAKGLVRFYFLDEHRSCIRWRPSRKNEKAKSEWGAGAPGAAGGEGARPGGCDARRQSPSTPSRR